MKRCIHPRNLTEPFFAFSKDITMLKKWFISVFPQIQKISQNLPKLRPKIVKNWIFNEKVHRIRETSQNVFRFFARYYDAKEVIHKRISWNPENISKSGPKFRPKIVKNWIFNEKVHRIRKTSQNRFSLFRKILRC